MRNMSDPPQIIKVQLQLASLLPPGDEGPAPKAWEDAGIGCQIVSAGPLTVPSERHAKSSYTRAWYLNIIRIQTNQPFTMRGVISISVGPSAASAVLIAAASAFSEAGFSAWQP